METSNLIKSLAIMDVKADMTINDMIFKKLWSKILADIQKNGDHALLLIMEYLPHILGFECHSLDGGIVCRKKHTFKNKDAREKIFLSLNPTVIAHEITITDTNLSTVAEKYGYIDVGDGKFSKTYDSIDALKHILYRGNPIYDELAQ